MIHLFRQFLLFPLVLLCVSIPVSKGCSCSEKPELDIRDLNDAELIFTATLEKYKIGMSAGVLTFKTKEVFKGNIEETITIYFQAKTGHTLFNKSVKFIEEKDWIIFARKKVVGDREYYRLIEVESSEYCSLSRPVKEKSKEDNYLKYLAKNGKQADGFQEILDARDIVIAEGTYKNNAPMMNWKYFRPDGRIEFSGEYKSGKREGEWLKYSTTSKGKSIVIQKRFYRQGRLREIHDLKYSGSVSFKKFLSDSTEIRHYLYDDGRINCITNKNKDEDTMHTLIFYKNGIKREEKYFKADKLIRRFRYDENGVKTEDWRREELR